MSTVKINKRKPQLKLESRGLKRELSYLNTHRQLSQKGRCQLPQQEETYLAPPTGSATTLLPQQEEGRLPLCPATSSAN